MSALDRLEAAASHVYEAMAPTAQIRWPLLGERAGAQVWVKHENHTPIGSFKVRGGLHYVHELRRANPGIEGVVCATRGNHGQSVAYAATRAGLKAVIVVPRGNDPEKNRAMRAFGGELVEHGRDYEEAMEHARSLAAERRYHVFPSFHGTLVEGVASFSVELLKAVPELEVVYVPIGLGSEICGMVRARDALRHKVAIVGVVAERAPAYALSFAAGKPVPTNSSDTFADGLAIRIPDPEALEIILKGVERIVTVSDEEMMAAMRHYFADTHNLAEAAGAATLAALLKECRSMAGRRVGLVLSGCNISSERYVRVLAGA